MSTSWSISQIEHTRHRSLTNCVINVLSALIAYTIKNSSLQELLLALHGQRVSHFARSGLLIPLPSELTLTKIRDTVSVSVVPKPQIGSFNLANVFLTMARAIP